MKTLKTMALIGASALAVSAASTVAAQAQPWHGNGYGSTAYAAPVRDVRLTTGYLDRLDARVTSAARARTISWGQARDLRAELRDAHSVAWRAMNGRASRLEVRRLAQTVDRVEAAVSRYAYNDRDHGWRR